MRLSWSSEPFSRWSTFSCFPAFIHMFETWPSKVACSGTSHYLNQLWLIAVMNKLQWEFNRNPNIFIHAYVFENVVCEMAAILSRPQCDKHAMVKELTIFFINRRLILQQLLRVMMVAEADDTAGAMMTSGNGNIFRVTGHLCGEFTGPRWIPHTKASDAELWYFLWSAYEWTVE